MSGAVTHYAVIAFSGDPAGEHPDPELHGRSPHLDFIAAGPEDWCWQQLARWTQDHPLRMQEEAEVVRRDPAVVVQQQQRSRAYREALREQQDRDLSAKLDDPGAGVS